MPRPERPLDAGDTNLLRFAADLRRLRERARSPGYRELSRRAHYSATSLSEAASGRRVPSLAVTLAYVRACGGDVAEWEARWRELVADTGMPAADASDAGERPPYVGLAAFQPDDAEWFFGRERLVDELVARRDRQRFLAIFGASGSGKSSLLRAGLLAATERDVGWSTLLITPGAGPFLADPGTLGSAIRQVLADRHSNARLLLVVDQFEEIFTLCHDVDQRARFIDALLALADQSDPHITVVLGVRADFYAHCAGHPALVEALRDTQVLIGSMTADELQAAITKPAIRGGCRVEGVLVSRLVADATGQPGVLPHVSHALLETWRRRHGTTLTLAGYEAAGGIQGAIARTAEDVYTAFDPEQRRLVGQIFLRLTALGEGTEDTKRRVARTELDGIDPDADTDPVLDRLTDARLIIVDRDSIEITHEALIRCWPRLYGWLTEDREGLRIHRQLTEATGAWLSLGRDPGALYRGTRLAVAEGWAASADRALTRSERAFLDASLVAHAAEQNRERRRSRRLRQLVALLAVLSVITTITSVIAIRAQQTASLQRDVATSQRVADEATALRSTDPALAAQLALAAFRLSPTVEARGALLSTFATPYATQLSSPDSVNSVALSSDGHTLATAGDGGAVRLWNLADPHRPRELATLTGHSNTVHTMAFSPAGRILATAGEDEIVRLWDITDARGPQTLSAFTADVGPVVSVAFGPGGRTLATAGHRNLWRVWDIADPRQPRELITFTGHTNSIHAVAPSPDGRTLATGGEDGTVRLWDGSEPERPGRPLTPPRASSTYYSLAFSPDGRTLATAGDDHTVQLWDTTDPEQPRGLATLTGHTDTVRSVAFSPDGRTLATGSVDTYVRLWDLTDQPRELVTLTGHAAAVNAVVFGPDGRTLATASTDHTTRLWDIPGPALSGHTSSLYSVAFSPDGRILATGSYDATVRLWDAADPSQHRELATLSGHTAAVNAVAFSPDGHTLATGSLDKTMRLWDVRNPSQPAELARVTGHADALNAVAFSPGGRTLATASADRTVRLIDITDPHHVRELAILNGHTDNVNAIAFGPDGRTLATGSSDRTARLWNVTDPHRPRIMAGLTGHTKAISSLAFSPDGRTLATAGEDRAALLWDLTRSAHPERLATLTGHADKVKAVAFGPDGRTLATGSSDRTAHLWNVTEPHRAHLLATLTGHTKAIDTVAFSPDGHTLATGSEDWTALLWETDPERAVDRVCEIAHPTIDEATWSRYFPGTAYQPPCDHRG